MQAPGGQAAKPDATKDLLPHLQTLESHDVLPPNQTPNPKDEPSWPQKTGHNATLDSNR